MNGELKELESEYMHIREAKRILGVCSQTLHNWDKQGKVRVVRNPSGTRFYHKEDIFNIACIPITVLKKKNYIYCRASSKKQVEDLRRQEALLRAQYPDHILASDIGSGLNWKRRSMQTILESVLKREVGEVVVAHRDRLCRFGFELLEFIFEKCGSKLIVLNHSKHETSEQELAEDLLSIVHIYSCRSMGKRRYASSKNKTISN